MEANMQRMTGAAPMMPQQMRTQPNQNQLQQIVYQNLIQNPTAFNNVSWQASVSTSDRMGRIMNLIANIALAMTGIDSLKAAEFGCTFEREAFTRSPSKEAYDNAIRAKTSEFFKKRQANETNIQNSLAANAQAQAQAAAQAQAQAQAMMNMQAQMGRGMGQGPQQGFQNIQHPMQASQLTQQQQQMGMGMGGGMNMNMAMANQAGRGMGPNQQMMGMPGAMPNRPSQAFSNEMSRLAPQDRNKVAELAQRMLAQATDAQKATSRQMIQARLTPQQMMELQSQNKDPLLWFYQNQAFSMLKMSMNRMQQTPNAQAAMMQQQQSQQSLRQQPQQEQQPQPQPQQPQQSQPQQQGMMNGAQGGLGDDISQFTPHMSSIKDQQLSGLRAQQAGQVVVPASHGPNRNATPQPMNQNLSQQGPNQTPRPQAAQPQQQPQQPQQQQQQQNMNLQQMKMNQAAQQSQAQLQAQAQMKQGQPGMPGVIANSQSPPMNTLNQPPGARPPNMNQMGNQNGAQGVQFGDQRFNQGSQRPDNQAFQRLMAQMTPEQRIALTGVNGMNDARINEVMQRWQAARQNGATNGGPPNPAQMQNRPQGPMGQMNPNMQGQMPVGMQQPGVPENGNPQQMPMARPGLTPQAVAVMDSMEVPRPVLQQLGSVPPEVKKWSELKMWMGQNNIPPNIRNQLGLWQQKQFHSFLQQRRNLNQQQAQQQAQQAQQQAQQQTQAQPQQPHQPQQQPQAAQNVNMNPGMQTPGGQMPNQQPGMQRPMPNIPPHVLTVTPQELAHIRNSKPNLSNMSDDQLRMMILQWKKQSFAQQQAKNQNQAAQLQGRPQIQNMQGQQNMGVPQAQMQLQQPPPPKQTPQTQNQQAQNTSGQDNTQGAGQNQANMPSEQARNARPQPVNNRPQPTPSPAQAPKNLKRPSSDETADVVEPPKQAAGPPRPTAQPNQPTGKVPQLTPQQIAQLSPEQRAKYENFLKMNMARNGGKTLNNQEALDRLKVIGTQEQRAFASEVMADIPMSPQEHSATAAKLHRMVVDMSKIGRGLSRWYGLVGDDQRARDFFRTRLRVMKQFSDGEKMSQLRDTFSMSSAEIDKGRAVLESMAKDLAASYYGRNMMKNGQQGTPQNQNAQMAEQSQAQQSQQQQQPQQQQSATQQAQGAQPALLNAANLAKNTQALNKQQKQPSPAGRAGQTPTAPTSAQPPFPFGASSPHGNPSYPGGKAKDLNLTLPPQRKKQKVTGQTPQGATPSPQISKKASPEMKRAAEPQAPPKPVFLCKDPDCETSTVGFSSEQALQHHIQEEHTKPKADPLKFVQECLAQSLGLEPDGSIKKEIVQSVAPAMSVSNSKQGQTPATLGATPMSTDVSMKRTASSVGKVGVKPEALANIGDSKQGITAAPTAVDPWAGSTIDPQSLMTNLALEPGMRNVISDLSLYRSATPNDTPESMKDSGSSEPNSDISEGATLEIDFDWQNLDTDLLLDMTNASLEGKLDGGAIDPAFLLEPTSELPPDWDENPTDFSKPFQFDTSFYYMETS